jgi:hypothetical protein
MIWSPTGEVGSQIDKLRAFGDTTHHNDCAQRQQAQCGSSSLQIGSRGGNTVPRVIP